MLRLSILCVGTLKERYLSDACAEYLKRLGTYCKPTVVEVPEARLPQGPSAAQVEQCILTEGRSLLSKAPKNAHMVALCIEGRQYSSEMLSAELAQLANRTSHVVFVIGGSHGLSPEVKSAASSLLSMSKMTFPHQLARVMLLEQLYRALGIAAGSRYHK